MHPSKSSLITASFESTSIENTSQEDHLQESSLAAQQRLAEDRRRDFTQRRSLLSQLLQDTSALLNDSLTHVDSYLTAVLPLQSAPHTPQSSLLTATTTTTADLSRHTLMKSQFQDILGHLKQLHARIHDPSSKVLVTGDVNAGKSSIINALMRADVLAVDQQPCTPVFLEVIDSSVNTDGKEEVHGCRPDIVYDVSDKGSYTTFDLCTLKSIAFNEDDQVHHPYQTYKVYASDRRMPGESLMKNGVVDVRFIDSPGLNRDTAKTMAVFAAQSDIDAVLFVVNAENHFTLSGTEFLMEAGKEKPYIFIVVNRFDIIQDKEKCKRRILDQVKNLLPKSYEHSSELVHFVSALQILQRIRHRNATGDIIDIPSPSDFSFINLECCLRSFLVDKRLQSKLSPAKHFLDLLSRDLVGLYGKNIEQAREKIMQLELQLSETRPEYDALTVTKEVLDKKSVQISDETCHQIHNRARHTLEQCLADVGQWTDSVPPPASLLYINTYAQDITREYNQRVLKALYDFEDSAIESCIQSVRTMYQLVQSTIIPTNAAQDETVNNNNKSGADITTASQAMNDLLDTTLTPIPSLIRQLSPPTHSQLVPIKPDLTDFLDLPDTQSLLQWSIGVLGAGIGSCFLTNWHRHFFHGLRYLGVSTSQFIAGSVMVVGVTTSVWIVSDMSGTVQRKLARKVRRHIRHSTTLHQQFHRVTYYSRKAIEGAGMECNRFIGQRIVEKRRVVGLMEREREQLTGRIMWLERMEKRVEEVRRGLGSIIVDDDDGRKATSGGMIVQRRAIEE